MFNRFERRIYIPLPDQEAREFLIKHNLKKNKNILNEKDIEKYAELTDGYLFPLFLTIAILDLIWPT